MRRRGVLIAVVVLGLAGPAAAQTEAELDAARATFAEGVELTREGRWSEAARRFREVMRVRATIQVKYNLGLALAHTGQLDEAERLLREAAEDETLDEASREEARRMLEEIEERRARGEGGEGGDGGEGGAGGDDANDASPDGGAVVGEEGADPEGEASGEGRAIDRPFTGTRPFVLEGHAGFSFFGFGLATGARFGIPLVNNGFVDSLDNALYLTVGADFYYVQHTRRCDCYGPGFGFPVTLRWQLYFGESLSAFVELGAQVFIHPRFVNVMPPDNGDFWDNEAGYWVIAAVGGSYRFGDSPVHLTLRLGTPYSSLGVAIDL